MDLITEESAASWSSKHLDKPCRSATRLTEGYGSYVYRAELDNDSTVILKHVQPFASRAQNFALDPERLTFEHAFLTLVPPHLSSSSSHYPLRLPKAISFSKEDHTLLISDHGHAPSLKAFLTSPPFSLDSAAAASIGHNLATFLASVHNLSTSQPTILDSFRTNDGGRSVSALVYFRNLVSRASAHNIDVSRESSWLADPAEREASIILGKDPATKDKEVLTVGDFWPGNVLVADPLPGEKREGKELVALDFELAKPGMKEFDIGQMAGELWMVRHFTRGLEECGRDGENVAGVVLREFLGRYAEVIDGEVDWNRVAIRVGTHLTIICAVGWEAKVGHERVVEVMRKGIDLLGRGWREEITGYKDIVDFV